MTEDQEKVCKSAIHAQDIADNMKVMYWTDDNKHVYDMKARDAHNAFAKLAECMGYKIERIEE